MTAGRQNFSRLLLGKGAEDLDPLVRHAQQPTKLQGPSSHVGRYNIDIWNGRVGNDTQYMALIIAQVNWDVKSRASAKSRTP
jgi:hypothetical protein